MIGLCAGSAATYSDYEDGEFRQFTNLQQAYVIFMLKVPS